MPYEEEDLQWGQPDDDVNALSREVIGAAIDVHRELGPGLDEALYEAAMAEELKRRGLAFIRQMVVPVFYKGVSIGDRKIDLVVETKLIVELKSVSTLAPLHQAQLLTYLKLCRLQFGLLINFNVPLLKDGLKRVINHS